MAGQTRTARLQIVDGDQALPLILAWGFENRGHRVWTAAGCRQAVATAQRVASYGL